MRIETTYYAFDDTEFDNAEECLAYEEPIKQLLDSCVFLNSDKEEITKDNLEDVQGNCFYIYVKSEKANELFPWMYDTYGFEYPSNEVEADDIFMWDERRDEWFNVRNRVNYLTNEMLSVIRAMKNVEE